MGPVVGLFAWYIVQKDKENAKLRKELKESNDARAEDNEKRVADAKEVNEALIGMNDKWMEVLSDNTQALDKSRMIQKMILKELEKARPENGRRRSHEERRERDVLDTEHPPRRRDDDSW